MSFTTPFFIFLFCLSISMRACNARYLGVVEKFHITGKGPVQVVEEVKLDMDSIQKGVTRTSKDCIDDKSSTNGGAITQNQKGSKEEEQKYTREEIPGLAPIKHLVSVSWRVPRKINHEKQPGFYSDYSRPHTRPPSHN